MTTALINVCMTASKENNAPFKNEIQKYGNEFYYMNIEFLSKIP